jgi:hypothetical protein
MAGNYMWWHRRLLLELVRLENLTDPTFGYNHKGLAGNTHDIPSDTLRYLEQLRTWGLVETCEPLWADAPADFAWFRLTDMGRQFIR